MVNIYKCVFVFLLLINQISCAYFGVPKNIKQGFTYCDNGEKTNLESLINIEGYYVEAKPLLDSKVGTYYINFHCCPVNRNIFNFSFLMLSCSVFSFYIFKSKPPPFRGIENFGISSCFPLLSRANCLRSLPKSNRCQYSSSIVV